MPDISKCQSVECPKRLECYRYTSEPSQYLQSYFIDTPCDIDHGSFDYFWDNKGYAVGVLKEVK